jgi:hypothetical protein
MTKQKLNNITNYSAKSLDGLTIGELNPIQTALIKDTDLFAGETDLSTNSFSVGQIKEVVSNSILSKTNNQLGTVLFHPAPAGYQGIPAETNGFGDAILVADGRELDKTAYIDLWNFIKTRKDKAIYGFAGETTKSFKIDELTDKITLPNLLTGDAVYMGNYGLQNAIFPQHTITSGNIQPTTQGHSHNISDFYTGLHSSGLISTNGGSAERLNNKQTDNATVIINPFTVSSSAISNLPAGITLGTDLKVAGVKMIPCIVCKPTYEINAGGGSGGGVATQDLDMNLFKIINVGMPIGDSDAVRLVDLKVDNGKILYKRDGVGGYDTLQVAIDELYNFNELYNGDLKSDRSVNLIGAGVFNSKQVTSMDDLKDSNIIVGNSARVITTLDSKLNQIDTNIDTINDNIGAVDITVLQTQTNTNTTDIATNLSLFNSYKNKINQFQEDWNRSNIASTVINSNPSALTNLTNIISGAGVVKLQTKRNNNGEALINNPTLIPITNGWKLPILDMKVYKLDIRVGVTGSLSGTAGTARELIVYLRRMRDNSIATNGGVIKINDNNFNGRGTTLFSYVLTENDTFITNGFYIDLLNNSGANLTLTSLNIFIAGV